MASLGLSESLGKSEVLSTWVLLVLHICQLLYKGDAVKSCLISDKLAFESFFEGICVITLHDFTMGNIGYWIFWVYTHDFSWSSIFLLNWQDYILSSDRTHPLRIFIVVRKSIHFEVLVNAHILSYFLDGSCCKLVEFHMQRLAYMFMYSLHLYFCPYLFFLDMASLISPQISFIASL